MNITLRPDQEALILAKLQSGQYKTVEEVIQAALQLLEERDRSYEQWIVETREKVDRAAESLDRGEGLDGEEVVERILEKFRRASEAQR